MNAASAPVVARHTPPLEVNAQRLERAGVAAADITGLLLAGGRGSRMGGLDKGLQMFKGVPLARHGLDRLRPQVGPLLLNANRHLAEYAAFGVPVCVDMDGGFAGPLAGFLAGLARCETAYLVTVPCDTPLFPHDLVARLAQALDSEGADVAMAATESEGAGGDLQAQPVFCLLRTSLRDSLARFVADGGRQVQRWAAQHRTVLAPFNTPPDNAWAFFNANTLDELRRLEELAP